MKGKVFMVIGYFIRYLGLDEIYKSEDTSVFVNSNSVFLALAKNILLCLSIKSVQNLSLSK